MNLIINPDIDIKESRIQGKGLFTKVPINKGTVIWISKGQKATEEKIYTPEEFKVFQKWCIDNGKEWDSVSLPDGTISAAVADRDNHPENYGNHSCEPNMDKNHVALRDIKAGEELTIDYAQFSDKSWSMNCSCNAKSCKGIVGGNV
jgi:SET domain-containing protein